MTNNTNEPREQPLESWKEIAVYLKRDVRTVIRWEKQEGLPVHRQMHQARGSVFAYPSELEAWKSSRGWRIYEGGGGVKGKVLMFCFVGRSEKLFVVLMAAGPWLLGRRPAGSKTSSLTTASRLAPLPILA